ncbi:ABC transporter substrate-binding protein [Manganibacter manganicus]|nr:ABC transporter substrate-binding protein [Pseudaminobacter manganicus]
MSISRRDMLRVVLGAGSAFAATSSQARASRTVRIGALKFGTVNWELETLKKHGFDAANGIDLDIVYFAGEEASNVAFLAGDLDIIVSDWLWVSRLRANGGDVTLVPYSTAVGAIMIPRDSPIRTLDELAGKSIAVAGGPLDKSWLLIRAMAERDSGIDLTRQSQVVYGAPPLLQQKMIEGEFDALLNFWHFCARLEAKGFRRLLGADDAALALGASGPVSALGYVFHEKWAARNPSAITGFIKASNAAKNVLASSDSEWQTLAPIVRAEGNELKTLRDRYREGIPKRPIAQDAADAAKLYRVLAAIGGKKLVGKASEMAPGTFWRVVSQ